MRLAVIPAAALAASIAGTAAADPAQCETRIGGAPVTIFYDDAEETIYSSLRERYLTRRNNCPGGVVIAYLMPDLTAEQRKVFCASYDPASRSHSVPAQGPRDAWGRCAAPSRTCSLVNATKDEALALVGIGEGAEAGTLPARV